MNTTQLIKLKDFLPEESWSSVFRSLIINQGIWESLKNEDFFEKALSHLGKDPELWIPLNLSLIDLDHAELVGSNLTSGEKNEELEILANETFENFSKDSDELSRISLKNAGLFALAIKERRENTGKWNFLGKDLQFANNAIWKPVFSCLPGLIEDLDQLITYLFKPGSPSSNIELGLHTLFSSPFTQEELVLKISGMLNSFSIPEKNAVLAKLNQLYPSFAQVIAGQVIETIGEESFLEHPFEIAKIYEIGNRYAEAIPLLDQAWDKSRLHQINLSSELANKAVLNDDTDSAIKAIQRATKLNPNFEAAQAEFAITQFQAGRLDPKHFNSAPQDEIRSQDPSIGSLVVQAKLAYQSDDVAEAKNLALKSLDEITENLEEDEKLISSYLWALAKLFFEMKMYQEASDTANILIKNNPNDIEMLALLGEADLAMGDLDKAIEVTQKSVLLDPNSNKNRKLFGKSLLANEDWVAALDEFETIVEHSSEFDIDAHYSLALSSLKAEKTEKSIENVKMILEKDETHGPAHALLGDALIHNGEMELGLEHLDQAISYSPEIAEPWLSMAKNHLDNGDLGKATEKLISANQAIPEDAKLRFELGKCYIAQDQSTKALSEIQHAASLLAADTPTLAQDVNIQLGSVLIDLGYVDEAKKRLSAASKSFPNNLNINHLLGKALMEKEEYPEAIEILSKVILSPNVEVSMFADYGEAHLNHGENPKEAIRVFEKLLENDSNNPKSLTRLAEAVALDGDLSKSLEIYKKALAKGTEADPELDLRIKIGMAKAAMASKKPQVAVAALEDLANENPEDEKVLRILTDAYLASDLHDNALKTLLEIEQLGQNLPLTLLWVADKALTMNKAEIATQALVRAADIAPEDSNILSRLGYMQLQNEETALAKEVFNRILEVADPDTKDLKLAAKALTRLEDLNEAIPYLKKAISLGDEDQSQVLDDLRKIYIQTNDFEKALEIIDQQIQLTPTDASLIKHRSEILFALDRPMAALASIHDAIKIDPDNPILHIEASALFRNNQDLTASVHHAEKALSLDPENQDIQIQAAEVYAATLDQAKLDEVLFDSPEEPTCEAWLLLKSERLLQLCETAQVHEVIKDLSKINPESTRYLAIKAQLLYNDGNTIEAKSILRKAAQMLSENESQTMNAGLIGTNRNAIIQAAITLGNWNMAMAQSTSAVEEMLSEPLPQLTHIKALALRAEYQHLCVASNVVKHAPGKVSLSQETIQEFEEGCVNALRTACTTEGEQAVNRWQARGQLAFGQDDPNLAALSNDSEDVAAQVAANNRLGNKEKAVEIAETQREAPEVLIQLAVTLSEIRLVEAQGAAYKATEKQANHPIYHALLAYLADENEEFALGLQSIRRALTIWGNEAEWHILAGQLQSRLGYRAATIAHFEKANQLRPSYAPYILELGKAHLSDQRAEEAIHILDQAAQINPENSEIWACLASAYQAAENYEQASFCVEKLTGLLPDQVEPHLVGARINLSAGKLKKANKLIDKALTLEPDLTEALQLQAQALNLANKPDEAIYVLDKAISNTSNPLPLLIERAKMVPLLHGEEKGLSTLKSIAKEYPKEPTILMALTDALIEAGKYDEAIQSAQYALKVNFGKLEQKDVAQLQYQLGILLRESGQYDLAIHYLNETIQLSPGYLNAYLEIAEVYRERRQHSEALEFLQQAISIAPNDARPFTVAGNLLKEAKDYQGAKDMFDRAASLAPKDVDIQRKLGAITALTLVHPNKEIED